MLVVVLVLVLVVLEVEVEVVVTVVTVVFNVDWLVVDGDEVVDMERVIPIGMATAAAINSISSNAPNVDAR